MESMRSFEAIREERHFISSEKLFESPSFFEEHIGIPREEFSVFAYSYDKDKLKHSPKRTKERAIEVLVDKEAHTIVVPPPHGGTIGVEDLAMMALPVVGFVGKTKPDIVIGCDRGARLYALAVYSMWGNSHPEIQFPTVDRAMHFARLSTSLGLDITSEALRRIIVNSFQEADLHGNQPNHDRLRLMFIDDWVHSGATRRQILESLETLGLSDEVEAFFAVMCGGSADVSGRKTRVDVPWQDDPSSIGVNYTRDGEPFPVRTREAGAVRKRLHNATRVVATGVKQK